MRKIPLPDENRRRAERITNEGKEVGADLENENRSLLKGSKTVKGDLTHSDFVRLGGSGHPPHKGNPNKQGEESDSEELIKKAAKRSAREYALLLVSTHTYTEKGLCQKMKSKRIYSDEEINDALEYVKSFGYVNDQRIAENAVQRLAEKCFGRSKICRYLASKGIDEDIIDSLDFSEIDFVYYCKRLLDRHRGKPDEKIMRALLNAGYTYDEIAEARRVND